MSTPPQLHIETSYRNKFFQHTRRCFCLKSKITEVEMVNDLPTIVPQGSENARNWFLGASWELSQIAQMAGCWVNIAGIYYCMTSHPNT